MSRDLTVNRTKPRDGLDMQTLDRNCEIIMITILKVLMDRWTIYISRRNFSREMESINKSQMEMLEMRNIIS